MKRTFLLTLCLVLVSSIVLAQAKGAPKQKHVKRYGGIECGSDPILPTDGTATDDYVGSSPSYYLVHLKAGHSYSAELFDSTDLFVAGGAQLVLLSSPGCTALPTTDVVSLDPDLSNNFADRISWIQSADADGVLQVNNLDNSGNLYSYTIRIVDTTLRNPRWSTYSAFDTQYALLNNTNAAITGTLTLTDSVSQQAYPPVNITVPAGQELFEIVSGTGNGSPGLNLPPNRVGFATFAFVGPAGAITADAYFLNPDATVVVPSSFAPRNYQH